MIPTSSRWLVVDAVQLGEANEPTVVDVAIEDLQVARQDLMTASSTGERRPLVVPLDDVPRNREVAIQIRQHPSEGNAPVFWHAIALADQHPFLFTIYEESAADLRGQATDRDKYAGVKCLHISSDTAATIAWNRPIAIREAPLPGQYRFIRFAFQERASGTLELEFERDASLPAVHYVVGAKANPDDRRLVRQVVAETVPGRWHVVTRDLAGDFVESRRHFR